MGETIDPFAAPQPRAQGTQPQVPQPQFPLPPSSAFGVDATMPPPTGPPTAQQPHVAPMGMVAPGQPDVPQFAAPYGQAPTYPGAPQYADRYMQPPVNPGAPQFAAAYGQAPGYSAAPQYAAPYPANFGPPQAMQYGGYWPPAWKRSWGTTMGRWGIGVAVAFVTSFALGMVAGIGEATPEAGGEVAGALAVGTWMYVLLIPWWLDHIVAGLGKAGAWAIHGGVSLLLAFLNFAYLSLAAQTTDSGVNLGTGAWMVLVMWAVAYGFGMLFADMLRKSYRPKAA